MHRKVLDLLRKLYPGFTIGQDVPLKTSAVGRHTTLYVDLVVKELHVAIECHGRQHFEYVQHFHQNSDGFLAHQARDAAKIEAIKQAGYSLLVVRHDEYESLTQRRLLKLIQKAIQEATHEYQ